MTARGHWFAQGSCLLCPERRRRGLPQFPILPGAYLD
jgi:hypothetical protein